MHSWVEEIHLPCCASHGDQRYSSKACKRSHVRCFTLVDVLTRATNSDQRDLCTLLQIDGRKGTCIAEQLQGGTK